MLYVTHIQYVLLSLQDHHRPNYCWGRSWHKHPPHPSTNMTHCFPNQRIPFPLQSPSRRLETFLLELKSIRLSNHYLSSPKWYWGSIIMYLHTDILFDDAINMCFSLTSHTCLLLAEACFWSVISVSSSKLIGIALISDSPSIAQYSHTALWPTHEPVPPVLRGLAARRAWRVRLEARSSGEVRGCHWKHAIFLYFCSLSPDTHEMQWSPRASQAQACLSFDPNQKPALQMHRWWWWHIQSKFQNLWRHCILCGEYLGLVLFYLRCLCRAISM